jgi:hypothetical protein
VADIQSIMVIAHAGHWLLDSAVFLPVVLFGIWLGIVTLRDRRKN